MSYSGLLSAVCCCTLLGTALSSPPPACTFGDEIAPTAGDEGWFYALLDTRFRLPSDYVPPDLVPVRQAGLADNRTLRSAVVVDLEQLLAEASRAGVRFELQSAYRSFEYQADVFQGWVLALGNEEAMRTSARPGHSEHQLGTALDLRSAGGPAPWTLADWALTREGEWLQENGWRYGFVMSYPAGKEDVTCYSYEPWHYRWFGREAASAIHSSGLTPREWLWRRLQGGGSR